jgi:hypothetical protein
MGRTDSNPLSAFGLVTSNLRTAFSGGLLPNLLVVIGMALWIWILGPHYEENGYLWTMIMRFSSSWTADYHHFNDMLLLQQFFDRLYAAQPNIPWFPVFLIGVSGISATLVLDTLRRVGIRSNHKPLLIGTGMLTCGTMLFGSLVSVHHNRAAFLMTASALALTVFSTTDDNSRTGGLLRWFSVLWFIVGALIRPEAAAVSFALFAPIPLVASSGLSLRKLKPMLPFACVVGMLMGWYQYKMATDSSFYFQMEPNVEYELLDRRNTVPLGNMTSSQDSARHMAATHWMLGDLENVTPAFMRSIIDGDKIGNTGLRMLPKWLLFRDNLYRFLIGYWYWLIALGMIPFAALTFIRKEDSLRLTVFLAWGGILLVAGLSINSVDRVLSPVLSVLCSTAWLLMLTGRTRKEIRLMRWAGMSGLALVGLGFLTLQAGRQASHGHEASAMEQSISIKLKELESLPERDLLIVMGDFQLFNTGIFDTWPYFPSHQLLFTEFGQYSANPAYLAEVARTTGCPPTDFGCRMRFVKENSQRAIIISTPKRIELCEFYLQRMFGFKLEIGQQPVGSLGSDVSYWLP